MKTDFEDYLRNEHAKDYAGLDDDMYEHFIEWISEFDYDDWIAYGNLYAKHFIK